LAGFIASDGCGVAFRDEGVGRPLLFVHGLSANAATFAPQAEALAGRFRIVRIDLRGHGGTPAEGALTLDRLAADVAELARALDLRGAILIGWSLGAMLAWDVLLSAEAGRFAGLVTIDMTPRVENDAEWRLGLNDDGARAVQPGETWRERCDRVATMIVADRQVNAALVARLGPELGTSDAEAVAAITMSMMARDYRPLLGRIAQATLIVHGAQSRYYGAATSVFLAEALPHARIVPFAHSGHAPHLEEPDRFNRLLAAFAASPTIEKVEIDHDSFA
jgi:pimeloyl-ACP methyl ester carboxylesterase